VLKNLSVGTTTLFVDQTATRVGIGTATPTATLSVTGNATVTQTLFVDGDHRDSWLREIAEVVALGLSGLDANHREVVELRTYAGLTFFEIAEVTGLPQGTVATRYRTALQRLRLLLKREMP